MSRLSSPSLPLNAADVDSRNRHNSSSLAVISHAALLPLSQLGTTSEVADVRPAQR